MRRPFALLGLLVVFGIGVWIWKNRGEDRIEKIFLTQAEIQERKDAAMAKQLQEVIATQSGTYALKVYRLESGESYGFDTDRIMPARSAIKVPIIMTAIRLGLDKQYDDLLLRMGKNSDNNAQAKIVTSLGVDKLKGEFELLNIKNTLFDENTTTADDLVEIWKKIFAEKEIYEKYFTDSIYEDRIAKGISEGVLLIHKVGTDVDVWNDSGIIIPETLNSKSETLNNNSNQKIKNSKPYILVILNENIKREEAEKMVPVLTKMVWDYETSL